MVCAVADRIDFYENNFFKSDSKKEFKSSNYGQLKERLDDFEWEYRLDEDYNNNFVGERHLYASKQEESLVWFNRLLKKPHRLIKFDEPIEELTESYSFKRGDLWVGGQK